MMESLESRRLLTVTVWAYAGPDHGREGVLSSSYQDSTGEHSGAFEIYSSKTSTDFGQLSIPYVVTGTAKGPGASAGQQDHTLASGVATINPTPYGAAALITFDALRDNLVEGAENVTITLQPGPGYQIGPRDANSYFPQYSGPTPATTSFVIDDDPPVVSISALGRYAAEPDSVTPPTTGTFRLDRSGGDLTQPLRVTLWLEDGAGQALPSGPKQDYDLSANAGTVGSSIFGPTLFPLIPAAAAGDYASFMDITVTPRSDHLVEGNETVKATLKPRSNCIVNPTASTGTIDIADREPTLNSLLAEDYYGQTSGVFAAAPGTSPTPTLYVSGPSGDADHAKVKLSPGLAPDTAEAFSQTRFTLKIDGGGATIIDSRPFVKTGTVFPIDWSTVPIGAKLRLDAGIDANDDGVLGAGEITRTMNVRESEDVVAANAVTIDTSTLPLTPGQWTNQGLIQHSRPPFNNAESFDYEITKVEEVAPTPAGVGSITFGKDQPKLTPGGKTRVDWIYTGTAPPAGVSYQFKVTFRSVTSPEPSNEVIITII